MWSLEVEVFNAIVYEFMAVVCLEWLGFALKAEMNLLILPIIYNCLLRKDTNLLSIINVIV